MLLELKKNDHLIHVLIRSFYTMIQTILRYLGLLRFDVLHFVKDENFSTYIRWANEKDRNRLMIAGRSNIVELLRLYSKTGDDTTCSKLLKTLRDRAKTEPWKSILQKCGFRSDPDFKPLRFFCIRLLRKISPRRRRHASIALDAHGSELARSTNGRHESESCCAETILLRRLRKYRLMHRLKHIIVFRAKYINFRQSTATTAESHPCIECAERLRCLGTSVQVTWSTGTGFTTVPAANVPMKHVRLRRKRIEAEKNKKNKRRRIDQQYSNEMFAC